MMNMKKIKFNDNKNLIKTEPENVKRLPNQKLDALKELEFCSRREQMFLLDAAVLCNMYL